MSTAGIGIGCVDLRDRRLPGDGAWSGAGCFARARLDLFINIIAFRLSWQTVERCISICAGLMGG